MYSTSSRKISTVVLFAAVSLATLAPAQVPLAPSPEWTQAMPPGPVAGTKITEEYATLVARDAYFWAWPLVNMYSRRLAAAKVPQIAQLGLRPTTLQSKLKRLGIARPPR